MGMAENSWLYYGTTFKKQRQHKKYKVSYYPTDLVPSCDMYDIPHIHACRLTILKWMDKDNNRYWAQYEDIRVMDYRCTDVNTGIKLFEDLQDTKFFTDYLDNVLMENLL